MTESSPSSNVPINYRITLITIVLTLGNLAICTHRSSRVYLYQQTICINYYRKVDATKIYHSSSVEETLCKIKDVQSPLSIIEGIDSFLMLLPALVVLAAYQQLLPIAGLRRLLLVNLSFSALGVFFSTYFFSFHQPWTVPAIISTFLFEVIGGSDIVRMILCITCIAAISPPERLTTSYNYISSLYFVGSLSGSTIGSFLLSRHVYILNACSITFFALAAVVAIFIPGHLGREDLPSPTLEDSSSSLLMSEEVDPRSPSLENMSTKYWSRKKTTITGTLLRSWQSSFYSITHLFRMPNPSFTVLLIFLDYGLATRIEILLPQYISLSLKWPLATVNSALAAKALVSATVLLALPTVRKAFLEPRMSTRHIDLFISQTCLLANIIGMVGLGFAFPAPMFVLSLCIYTSGCGLSDSFTAYGTLTLPPGITTSDFYVRCGLIQTISGMAAAPIWAGIFSLVLRSEVLPMGLPFWICAGLFGLALGGIRILKRWAAYSAIPQV